MTLAARIELRDFPLATQIGTYGPGQSAPDQHRLDLTLWIPTDQVLVHRDGMEHVFDYDPLVLEIERLSNACQYETQERLVTCIAHACASFALIDSVEIALRKLPIRPTGGSLGVRLLVSAEQLKAMRTLKAGQGVQ